MPKLFIQYTQALAVLFFFLACPSLYALNDADLIQKAKDLKLADQKYWHSLLHYDSSLSGTQSRIDDPAFFLSKDGKADAEAELIATIKAFSTGDAKEKEHAINRFPARLDWLLEKIPQAKDVFAATESAEFTAVWSSLEADKVTLVFPSEYMNNPASIFGHTLLNVEGKKNEKLLAYSVNYAAFTEDEKGFVYAWRGVFGSYKGFYSIDTYYKKVIAYNDMEMRDIWEYELDLNKQEIKRFLLHFWEIKKLYSYYYFFDENCSYNLLFTLDAAKPGLNLVEQFGKPWVLPVDTVKLIKKNELIKKATFRASRAAKIRAVGSTLSKAEKKLAADIAIGNDIDSNFEWAEALSQTVRIRVYDLASELIAVNHSTGKLSEPAYQKLNLRILRRRAKLGQTDGYEIPIPADPVKTHGSSRFRLGAGSLDNDTFLQVAIRGTYHGLEDPWPGTSKGSGIEAFNLEFNYFPDDNDLDLRRLELVNVHSLTPGDDFFQPVSWRVSLGLESIYSGKDNDLHLSPYLDVGAGYTFALKENLLVYLLGNAKFNGTGHLDRNHILTAGPETGLLHYCSPKVSSQLSLKHGWSLSGQDDSVSEASLRLNWHLYENMSLSSYYTYNDAYNHSWKEYGISLSVYF